VLIEHGGLGGATAAAPRAREVMRIALLKDPEMRARIEKPLPPAAEAAPDALLEGVAPPAPTAPARRPLSPRPERRNDPQRRPHPARRTRSADRQVRRDRLDLLPDPVPDRRGGRDDDVLGRGVLLEPWAAPHLIRFGVFFVMMIILAMVDLRVWFAVSYPVYAVALVLLVGVELFGDSPRAHSAGWRSDRCGSSRRR
jgi:hypothetical protein